jgi:CxxC motif-containing protein (DUF1111 family)
MTKWVCVASLLLAGLASAQAHRPSNLLPLDGLSPAELDLFEAGESEFFRVWSPEDGLGPFFNTRTCASCHYPANGLSGYPENDVTVYGREVTGPEGDELFLPTNGLVLRTLGITADHKTLGPEEVPDWATVQESRKTPRIMGLGLVEAVPDSTFEELAGENGGRVVRSPQTGRVMRWGTQNQLATLMEVVESAYSREMGLTRWETGTGPLSSFYYLLLLDSPESVIGEGLRKYVDRGEVVFNQIGCASCHTPTLRTADGAFSVGEITVDIPALQGVEFSPYSDFLLHDMGALDRSDVHLGQAGKQEFRTTPLWGRRFQQTRDFHDGGVPHYPLDETILRHDGEAAAAREAWKNSGIRDQENLRRFVDSR